MEAKLYLVATPIGNLEDITYRALRVLKEVDLIAAEDTRHTKKLLNHFEINTPLTSYFEHNKRAKGEYILSILRQGKSVAVVSDAGMPGISDPGADIVKEAISEGFQVIPVPGASASLAALVVSGLPTDKFIFEGFLPREKKEKREILETLVKERRTVIFYESPYRVIETLEIMKEILGDRQAATAREITKKFEEINRGTISELLDYFSEHEPKGEFTLVIQGAPEVDIETPDNEQLKEEIDRLIQTGYSKKEAIKEVARHYKLPKRDIYKISLED